jgi:hypothetical protein
VKTLVPLGKAESLQLEFKGRQVLQDLDALGRAAVAMLNSEGGEVWVGLHEEAGTALAVEPILDPDSEKTRILDFLVDKLEPPLTAEELQVETFEVAPGNWILRLALSPDPRKKPYAFLRPQGGRQFLIRIADRVRPMDRDEILHGVSHDSPRSSSDVDKAVSELLLDRRKLQEERRSLIWIRVQPVSRLDLDLQDEGLQEVLIEPRASRNRASGFTFVSPHHQPRLEGDRLVTTLEQNPWVTVWRSGRIECSAPLEFLYWRGQDQYEVYPYCLLEYPVSALRIASTIFARSSKALRSEVVADLALFGLEGWKLRQGSPQGTGYARQAPIVFPEADLVSDRPLVFAAQDFLNEPDRCALRLVEQVYEAFGFGRDQIPPEFDQRSGRLVLSR